MEELMSKNGENGNGNGNGNGRRNVVFLIQKVGDDLKLAGVFTATEEYKQPKRAVKAFLARVGAEPENEFYNPLMRGELFITSGMNPISTDTKTTTEIIL